MDPIVLIHGYSAESSGKTKEAIAAIYGSLPDDLRKLYGGPSVVEIDVGRYVSLEDGVTVDDISRALDRVLRDEHPDLLGGRFNVLVHSTGALVIRNWIRRFSRKPSPIRNLVYLAGANFGSGWAHIGKGQLAKWSRLVFQGGSERGVRVLDALELGASWTLDMHRHFLGDGRSMADDYKVLEYVVVGSQADVSWFEAPIRYAKEDGSDGVVRVAASNVNFHYLRFGPTQAAVDLAYGDAGQYLKDHLRRRNLADGTDLYEIKESSRPGVDGRPEVPFAIPYQCAHSGKDLGIVTGSEPKDQVLRLIDLALTTKNRTQWAARVGAFQAETDATYAQALTEQAPPWWKKWIDEPRAQYDRHAQVVFRVRDQDGRPVEAFDIFFHSDLNRGDAQLPIGSLFEDKHLNGVTKNVITFYLRTDAFSRDSNRWESRLAKVEGCFLEVSATEPETDEILYLPMRFEFTSEQLLKWIQGDRTTIIDVDLLRLPSPEIFRLPKY